MWEESGISEENVENLSPRKPVTVQVQVVAAHENCGDMDQILAKIAAITKFLVDKTSEMYINRIGPNDFRQMEVVVNKVVSGQPDATSFRSSDPQTIVLLFVVGNFTELNATTEDMLCVFECSGNHVLSLPDINLYLDRKMEEANRNLLGSFMGHILHEMFFALGAYNSNEGIMQHPAINILRSPDISLNDLCLASLVDPISFGILTESLSSRHVENVTFKFRMDREGCFLFDSSHCVTGYVFLLRNKYTSVSERFDFTPYLNYISVAPPVEWDSVLICQGAGPFVRINRITIETRRNSFSLKPLC